MKVAYLIAVYFSIVSHQIPAHSVAIAPVPRWVLLTGFSKQLTITHDA